MQVNVLSTNTEISLATPLSTSPLHAPADQCNQLKQKTIGKTKAEARGPMSRAIQRPAASLFLSESVKQPEQLSINRTDQIGDPVETSQPEPAVETSQPEPAIAELLWWKDENGDVHVGNGHPEKEAIQADCVLLVDNANDDDDEETNCDMCGMLCGQDAARSCFKCQKLFLFDGGPHEQGVQCPSCASAICESCIQDPFGSFLSKDSHENELAVTWLDEDPPVVSTAEEELDVPPARNWSDQQLLPEWTFRCDLCEACDEHTDDDDALVCDSCFTRRCVSCDDSTLMMYVHYDDEGKASFFPGMAGFDTPPDAPAGGALICRRCLCDRESSDDEDSEQEPNLQHLSNVHSSGQAGPPGCDLSDALSWTGYTCPVEYCGLCGADDKKLLLVQCPGCAFSLCKSCGTSIEHEQQCSEWHLLDPASGFRAPSIELPGSPPTTGAPRPDADEIVRRTIAATKKPKPASKSLVFPTMDACAGCEIAIDSDDYSFCELCDKAFCVNCESKMGAQCLSYFDPKTGTVELAGDPSGVFVCQGCDEQSRTLLQRAEFQPGSFGDGRGWLTACSGQFVSANTGARIPIDLNKAKLRISSTELGFPGSPSSMEILAQQQGHSDPSLGSPNSMDIPTMDACAGCEIAIDSDDYSFCELCDKAFCDNCGPNMGWQCLSYIDPETGKKEISGDPSGVFVCSDCEDYGIHVPVPLEPDVLVGCFQIALDAERKQLTKHFLAPISAEQSVAKRQRMMISAVSA